MVSRHSFLVMGSFDILLGSVGEVENKPGTWRHGYVENRICNNTIGRLENLSNRNHSGCSLFIYPRELSVHIAVGLCKPCIHFASDRIDANGDCGVKAEMTRDSHHLCATYVMLINFDMIERSADFTSPTRPTSLYTTYVMYIVIFRI